MKNKCKHVSYTYKYSGSCLKEEQTKIILNESGQVITFSYF